MVHGNVGQSDLTREDMTRYIRYLVDVIGNEQKALYSYLEDRTNPYICLHGECQTLADWISVLLEAYNEPFKRWDMGLDLLVFGRLVNKMKPNEVPKQITDWYLYGLKDFPSDLRGRKYIHTVIEWDGLYWDANGGGTRLEKEEYYEGMTYWADGQVDRKRLLHNFFDWGEMKGYLEWPLEEEAIDYTWHWTESLNREGLNELWIEEMGVEIGLYDNSSVFRDFINHLRVDDFAAERIYFDDEYGGFIKGNPRANELPGEVLFPGEDERLAKIMSPEEYAELEQEVNLILSKNLPYNVESLGEDERIALHEDIIMKILNHEYIHQSIDDEVLEWAIENNKTKGDYYAAHEIMAYVDMALRESLGMRDFKLQLTSLVSQHPILTDNPELSDRIMDALTRTRKGQRFQVPAEIETLMRAFYAEDYEILLVGGAVRDMLMGLEPKDYDLATNATPEEVEAVVSELEGYRTVTTPKAQMARGVLTTLVLPPSGEVIEVTTFRAELGYEDGTRRPVAVAADTFYEDSLRRDFTMNALGWRLNGTILDYHEGVDDIEFGQLVAVGDASERLKEDPLRILRAVRFASRYGLEIDDELGGAIETNLPQLLTLSPERIRRELDTILKSEEGVYDLFETGILETIIPEYKGIYWGERHYDELPVITSVRSYGQIDRELTPYEQGLGWKSEPWQPAVAYALLLQDKLTREEFNEQYRRGPISFSKAEADMIAELIELYPVALESEEPADIVTVVTSPYYAELMLMLEYTNRSDLVDYFKPYRSRYKGKPPKGYAMTVADDYGIEPGPALGDKISEITEAIILGDIEDWDEGLNYYAAEEVGTRERIAYAGVILDEDTSKQLLAHFETLIPESWTRYAHHMTVSLGKSIPNQADLGKEVTLTVTAVGKSDDAIAVAVSGYPSRNAIPHITLAVPPGGKPFNSNKITDWHSVEPFEIQGQLQDVKTYVAEEIDTLHESLNYPRGFYSKRDNFKRFVHEWHDWYVKNMLDDFYWGNDEYMAETFESESHRDWSHQYTWQPVPVEDFLEFRRLLYTPVQLAPQYQLDDILNLKTLYRGTRKPSSIREGMFDFFGSGVINEREQIPETVYFYTWERPYEPDEWREHNSSYECACEECKKYAFNHINVSYINSGLIRSLEFKPEWEETPAGSEIVRVLFIPHLSEEISVGSGFESRRYRSHLTRNNLNLEDYGFEPVIWSKGGYSKNNRGEFYSSPYNTNLRALEQRLGRGVRRTLNYPRFSSETVTKYAESFWGDAGSGVLVVARDTQRILLGLRSEDVNEPNTWGNFGGAIGVTDFGEPEEALPPEENALKEMAEEIGYTGAIEMIPSFTYRSPDFTYYNFIGVVDRESDVPLNRFNWEVSELRWFTLDEVMALSNLHFGVSALMSQEEMITFNAPGIADEEYRKFLKKDFEITMKPQFVLFEELPQITQDDIVYMASHPTWGNSELSNEYSHIHPNYLKRDLIGLEFPVFYMPLSEIEFSPNHRRRHMPTVINYSNQQEYTEAPPILVSGDKFIDGGHRFLAYELAGRRTIPVVDIGNLLTATGLLEWIESSATIEDPISWDVGEDSLLDFTFDAEPLWTPSVPMSDWSKLSPVELVKLSQFPTADDHMDGWDMYLPRDWPHWDVLERAEEEHWQMEQKYLKDNDLKYPLPWGERHKLPSTLEEIYAKYFDFWYIPGVAHSMSGGGYGQIYDSLKEAYAPDTWKRESDKRGLPCQETLSLEEAAKYFSPQTIERYREQGRKTIHVLNQPIVDAYIDEYLALGREGIFYAPVIAAAPIDAEVGTDASREARLLDGWHRDAYANLLYDQDPSQGGAPTVFFKPKEEYL